MHGVPEFAPKMAARDRGFSLSRFALYAAARQLSVSDKGSLVSKGSHKTAEVLKATPRSERRLNSILTK